MKVSIKELKDHLSAYLKKVQVGEEMIITFHDNPIAKIVPIANLDSSKISRGDWIKKIRQLHQSLRKLKIKEPMSETVIKRRKEERF